MKIVTAVVNNPIFIEIQYYTLKRYMKCEYEFIVFNDAKSFPDFTNCNDTTIKRMIGNICNKLGIKCMNIPNQHHKQQHCAAIRCADSMNYILNFQKHNPDKYLLIDSDMFLIDDFKENDYENYDCAVVLQSRNNHTINYMWNGLYYFDFNRIKNSHMLNWNCCKDCDVGGMMQTWLLTQRDNIYFINHLSSETWDESEIPENLKDNSKLIEYIKTDPRNINGKFFCEIYDNKFLHYRAGGDWERRGLRTHVNLSYKLKAALL